MDDFWRILSGLFMFFSYVFFLCFFLMFFLRKITSVLKVDTWKVPFIFQRAQQFGFLRKVKWFFVILDVFKAFQYGNVQKKYSKKHFSSILEKCLEKAVEAFKVWASRGITAERKFSKWVLRAKRAQKSVKIISEWKYELFWTFWKN